MELEACGSGSSGEADDKIEILTDSLVIEHTIRKGRSREREKERTKLRERRRRLITSNILAGLRRYGNYNLPVRADINDVIKALAHEAGWTVEIDGTTFRSKVKQWTHSEFNRDYSGSPYISVYVTVPLSVFKDKNQLVNAEGLKRSLCEIKSANFDGIMVECCWGLVERENPQQYDWSGYVKLFHAIREADLKLQVAISFHECVENDMIISLPGWVLDIGDENPDIFFTDQEGRRNRQCLSWGVDRERVLKGRTGMEVYYDFMRSFRQTFEHFFQDKTIVCVEVGLGAKGELQYPSHYKEHGWIYPGIGQFQCFDKYLQKSLKLAAAARGCGEWGRVPESAGFYNSSPQDALFFTDGGDYDRFYGRFFLHWYSGVLLEHGEQVLSVANILFKGTKLAAKISAVHWTYNHPSHAAELTAGFYNCGNHDGYLPIVMMLAKQNASLSFVPVEPISVSQQDSYFNPLVCPEGLQWQVFNACWEAGIPISSTNTRTSCDRGYFAKIVADAKPYDDPEAHHLSSFIYSKLSSSLLERPNFQEFKHFVACMHGFAVN